MIQECSGTRAFTQKVATPMLLTVFFTAEVVLETTSVSLLKRRFEAFFLYARSLLAQQCGKRTGRNWLGARRFQQRFGLAEARP